MVALEPRLWMAAALGLLAGCLLGILGARRSRSLVERLSAALQASQAGTWQWDIRHDRVEWDPALARLYGLPSQQAPRTAAAFLELVHPDDRERIGAEIRRAVEQCGDAEYEFRTATPAEDGGERWIYDRSRVVPDARGRARRMLGFCSDVTARKRIERELRAGEERLRLALEAAHLGAWEVDLRSHKVTRSARALEIFGFVGEAEVGAYPSWRHRIHPEDRERTIGTIDAACAGERDSYRVEYRFLRPDGQWIWVESHGRVVERDASTGKPLRLTGTTQDITERKQAEERRDLMTRELEHRSKNALAVVQAALRLTPRDDAETFAHAVEGRVAALARANRLLAQGHWEGSSLDTLLKMELAPFLHAADDQRQAPSAPQVAFDGPDLVLEARAVPGLAMALHELATNATKHGALSAPEGRLRISWRCDPDAGLTRLKWEEQGGPPVAGPPAQRGFGSRVIEATVRDQLGGTVRKTWEPSGMICDIELPLSLTRAGDASGPTRPATSPADHETTPSG